MKNKAIIVSCGLLSANAAYYWNYVFNLEQFVKKYQLKENNSPVALSKNVQNLITTVVKDMKLSEEHHQLMKPFAINDLEANHFGFLGREPGTFIGIPKNFLYEFDQIDFENLPVKIDLTSLKDSELDKLKSSLSLSEKAKKFAIAQELYKSAHLIFFCPTTLTLALCPLFYAFMAFVEKRKNKKIEKFKWIFLGQAFFTFFCMFRQGYIIMSDHQDGYADIKVAKMGREYIEGGIEYIEKYLALREILNKSEDFFQKGYKDILGKDVHDSIVTHNYRLSFFRKLQGRAEEKEISTWTYLYDKYKYGISRMFDKSKAVSNVGNAQQEKNVD